MGWVLSGLGLGCPGKRRWKRRDMEVNGRGREGVEEGLREAREVEIRVVRAKEIRRLDKEQPRASERNKTETTQKNILGELEGDETRHKDETEGNSKREERKCRNIPQPQDTTDEMNYHQPPSVFSGDSTARTPTGRFPFANRVPWGWEGSYGPPPLSARQERERLCSQLWMDGEGGESKLKE